MRAAVIPEEASDVGNRLVTGNQVQSPVVDTYHGRADKRTPGQIGQPDMQIGPLSGTQFGRLGFHLDIQHPLFGRNKHLPHHRVNLPLRDRQCLDKKVRHVSRYDLNLLHGALPLHPDQPGWRTDAIRSPNKQQDRRVHAIGVDHQPDFLADRVLPLVGQ